MAKILNDDFLSDPSTEIDADPKNSDNMLPVVL